MRDVQVLIIDDEEFYVEVLIEDISWEKCGIDPSMVHGVYSVRQAKKYLTEHTVNILICDIEMPGESGLELVEWVTEWARFNEEPVECIMLTCHPEYDFTRKALQLGCLDYLLKPMDTEDMEKCLVKAVSRIMEKKSSARKAPRVTMSKEDGDIIHTKILPYIEKNLGNSFSVTDLADYVSLNPQYMMRLFKKTMGISVLEYVTGQRMNLAKELLLKTDWSQEVISEKVGYYSSAYFSKVFKRIEGMTPGEYRRRYS